MLSKAVAALLVVIAVGVAVYFGLIWQPAIEAIARPDPRAFARALIGRGASLARLGNCDVCHTAEGGASYAGARGIPTPFGVVYATNLTPDEATGIGSWSFAAFRRAMLDGIARDGSHLYPALPYDHFTHVTDPDLAALYAFLMTRSPVARTPPPNNLIFPLGFRPLLAGWDLLFLHHGPVHGDAARSAQWNRGAYLAEGLGHCGTCHTPRNLAGGEKRARTYAGGVSEGWNAPALDASNPSAGTWSAASLYNYLHTGMEGRHSAAAGPMGPVAHDLATVPDADVRAIAVYIDSLMHTQGPRAPSTGVDRAALAARTHPRGAALFAGACDGCHGEGAPMVLAGRPGLSEVSALQEADPRNTVQSLLQGLQPPAGERGPFMPPFADAFSNADLAQLAAYLRARYSTLAPWPRLMQTVAGIRDEDTGS